VPIGAKGQPSVVPELARDVDHRARPRAAAARRSCGAARTASHPRCLRAPSPDRSCGHASCRSSSSTTTALRTGEDGRRVARPARAQLPATRDPHAAARAAAPSDVAVVFVSLSSPSETARSTRIVRSRMSPQRSASASCGRSPGVRQHRDQCRVTTPQTARTASTARRRQWPDLLLLGPLDLAHEPDRVATDPPDSIARWRMPPSSVSVLWIELRPAPRDPLGLPARDDLRRQLGSLSCPRYGETCRSYKPAYVRAVLRASVTACVLAHVSAT
jgi:hypothetical protein